MINDLIKRLTAATEGSRELDALIWAEVCDPTDFDFQVVRFADGCEALYEPEKDGSVNFYAYNPATGERNKLKSRVAPPYSTSIDAALTLVPEGWYGQIRFGEWPPGRNLKAFSPASLWNKNTGLKECLFAQDGHAATPALSFCIAALKARKAVG